MFDMHRVELDWGGRKLTLETGRVARQADGAVLATYGETTVLAAVVAAKQPKEGIDFLPLTVNYTEKYYAAGRIPGGYFKRERGPTEKDTLTSRLIDRPIRPSVRRGLALRHASDRQRALARSWKTTPTSSRMVAASAALTLSGAPFMGPIAGARVGFINNEYVLNPALDEMPESQLDLVIAGTQDAVMMVESEAKELSEEIMLGAVMFGHRHFQPVIEAIIRLAEKAAKEPRELAAPDNKALEKEILGLAEKDLRAAYSIVRKQDRQDAVAAVKEKVMAHFFPEGAEPKHDKLAVAGVFKELEAKIVRWNILDTNKRIDGRDLKTVRPIVAEVGVLPRTHGSALFTRGETQALVVATLGTAEDEQLIDALQGTYKETFLLHYNFPPFSVGETGRVGAPGRREIGHGKLAWRAIHPMLPTPAEFPYTIRVVSEITESNGSSSMASVCGILARADGCGRAAQTADRRHRHGPHSRRQALRGAVRHPRRRGPSRRHGLQGGRHRAGRHLAADGHQDRRYHRRDHEGRARPGEGWPPAHPRRDGQGAHRRARRTRRACPAHRDVQDSDRQDP